MDLTDNYYKYVEIANEDKLEMSITNILSNPSLYREAQHLQKQVDVLQSDTAILSIAVNEWLVLLESEVLDPYKANIRKRMEEATEPFFFVANMMDPQYLGRNLNLTSQQEELAEEWISEFHPEYLAGFMAFRIKDPDLFPKIMFSEQILNLYKQQPAKWWSVMENRTLKTNNLPSGFCNIFANLLTCHQVLPQLKDYFLHLVLFGLN
ncbi:hypothetical protein Anas_14058 [Armadillidium nasatum]|uniref:Uncharacterized protein n=1 Tax=Armadillidium nasatum TaxID=96803 RepID=A0A5N5TBL9_9CRUS|nr:hypothetical protein Anas_14058 [Armadillidium nasatum]